MAFGTESKDMNEAEQEQILDETLRIVKTQAFEMKRCLDRKEIMEGLRFANVMLAELRLTTLSPKFYYRLYIDVSEVLNHFLSYLQDEYLNGDDETKKIGELYELVQFAGNIIPRLYLMITVGVAYIKSKEAPRKDILRDLLDMCRGVQNPLKGLFLRNYLLTSTKELLPVGPPSVTKTKDGEISDGDINDSIDFIMTNFSEMNKLWFRMQHQGPSKERDKRERERRELRILVGTNLVCLSKMELLDLEMYQTTILPGILEQVVSCGDFISQEYLMECLIQVFPDEFHLATLSEFLSACAELHASVKIKNVFCAIIDRLAAYALDDNGPGIPAGFDLFKVFSEHAEKVITTREGILPEDIVAIQKALANLAIKCYPENVSFTSTVFQSTASIFNQLKITNVPFNNNVGRELIKLLKLPVENYTTCLAIFELNAYSNVLNLLNYRGKTQVCTFFIQRIIETNSYITSEDDVEKLFYLLETLVLDQEQQPKELEGNEDFIEEQNQVARLVHLIYNEDADLHFRLLSKLRKIFGKGGPHRLRYTLAPVVFSTYKLLNRYSVLRDQEDWDAKVKRIFHFCMNTISVLKSETEMFEMCLKLLLQGALIADRLDFKEGSSVTYEFVSNAFTLYEEDLVESRVQVHSLSQMVGAVQQLRGLSDESHQPLRNQCAMYASRLLKKPDQARSLCLVAHLFWHSTIRDVDGELRDGQRVAECLKKAIKVSSQCLEDFTQINSYVYILSNYLHFYELGCDKITSATVNQLIDKIRDALHHLAHDPSSQNEHLNETFMELLAYVRHLKDTSEGDLATALNELSL